MIGIQIAMLAGCVDKKVPHAGTSPLFALTGAHFGLPCEACHGTGTPKKLDTSCLSCHYSDVPEVGHYPGQECSGCHTTVAWDDLPSLSETGTTPVTDTTTDTQTVPFVHEPEDPNEVCWDCHDGERNPADPAHYTTPERWDCGPCHTMVAWSDPQTVHPVRTPHGEKKLGSEQAAANWVVACTNCHPVAPPDFVCSNCHTDIFPHFGGAITPGSAADATCLGCHPIGEY